MQTLGNSAPAFFSVPDTALSDTARELRTRVQSAIDPPLTSRQVRRAQLREQLLQDASRFAHESDSEPLAIRKMLASVSWAEAFIESALPTTSDPDVAIDQDGEVLFEWLNGPREVATVSVGPAGVVNFATLVGSSRFHGVTRIGDRNSGPLLACLAQFKAPAAA
jgi:hypothetical protein